MANEDGLRRGDVERRLHDIAGTVSRARGTGGPLPLDRSTRVSATQTARWPSQVHAMVGVVTPTAERCGAVV